MLTAFSYDQLYFKWYGKSEMWKRENVGHAQNNVTTAKFAINLTANICLLLAT